MEIVSNSEEESKKLAKRLIQNLLKNHKEGSIVVELVGDLGAGKTTFMKGIGEELGIVEDIISPTFLIQRNYEIPNGKFKNLIHIDAYRIEKEEELKAIHFEEYANSPENIIFIEWPANLKKDLPGAKRIEFFHESEKTRKIIFRDEDFE